jgi:hypothetical protein
MLRARTCLSLTCCCILASIWFMPGRLGFGIPFRSPPGIRIGSAVGPDPELFGQVES